MNEKIETVKEEVKAREKKGKKEAEKKGSCGECKWYDKSTERDFHRDGIRKGLVEVRAICRNEKIKACGHLVHDVSIKDCFEPGVYVPPKLKA